MEEEKVNTVKPQTKNPEVYKALLEINQQEASIKARQEYLKAYLLSVVLSPLGLFFFIKYFFFSDTTDDNRKAAIICLVLTVLSLILSISLFNYFFNQIAPKNNKNSEFLQELITPENQKTMKELLQ